MSYEGKVQTAVTILKKYKVENWFKEVNKLRKAIHKAASAEKKDMVSKLFTQLNQIKKDVDELSPSVSIGADYRDIKSAAKRSKIRNAVNSSMNEQESLKAARQKIIQETVLDVAPALKKVGL